MIPIVFASNATTFTTNGIGRLADTVSCVVEEERNGLYELTLTYVATGAFAEYLVQGNLIVAKPNKKHDRQAFRIYKVSKPFNQIITVNARHISYDMGYIPVEPFQATGITATIAGLEANSMVAHNFTFTTDLTNEQSNYNQMIVKSLRACLGGTENSVLQTFSGSAGVEYEWDNFNTFITLNRGQDNGVSIRYGKNLTDILNEIDNDNLFTSAVAFWTNAEGTVCLYSNVQTSSYAPLYGFERCAVIDASGDFENEPSVAQLDTYAFNTIEQAAVGIPKDSVKVSFVDLSDTQEYKDIANLETVNLCDIVTVKYPPLGVNTTTKVIRTVFDTLRERYTEVELGEAQSDISKTLASAVTDYASVVIGDKIVSVVSYVNTEIGEVSTTIESVESYIDGINEIINTHTTQITANTTAISTKVSASEVNDIIDGKGYEERFTEIEQTAEGITQTIGELAQTEDGRWENLETYISSTPAGVTVGKSNSDIRGVFGNTALNFYDRNDTLLAWLSALEGLGAVELSVGDATQKSKRWRLIVSEDGNHFRITRHKG